MSVVWSVLGEKELKRALRNSATGKAELKAAHKEAAEVIEKAARPDVPRRTGKLQASLRSSGTLSAGVVRAGGKGGVDYAPFVHFGVPSKGMAPQPFLYDAADHRRQAVLDVFRNATIKRLAREGLL